MPTNDPEYMRDYQRKRRARSEETDDEEPDDEEPLGQFILRSLPPAGIDAILDGVRSGNADAWRTFREHVRKGKITVEVQPRRETHMDEPVKKAIEPEQVKPDGRGKLSKGLGDVPGLQRDPYREVRPAPKPGKDKR